MNRAGSPQLSFDLFDLLLDALPANEDRRPTTLTHPTPNTELLQNGTLPVARPGIIASIRRRATHDDAS
jgi:hypothetical protein